MKKVVQKRRKFDLTKPKTYTNQGIFDFVVMRLADQGKQSRDCFRYLYRGDSGLKCAIGHLIPDHLYTPEMDRDSFNNGTSLSVEYLLRNFDQLKYLKPFENLLSDLQITHDFSTRPEMLKRELKAVAKKYGLKSSLVGVITKWTAL